MSWLRKRRTIAASLLSRSRRAVIPVEYYGYRRCERVPTGATGANGCQERLELVDEILYTGCAPKRSVYDMFARTLVVAVATVLSCAAGDKTPSRVPSGSKIFIAPMEGNLHGFIAPEIIKKKIPLVVVTDEKDADFILTGASIKGDDKWYHTGFGGKEKNEGNVQLISVKGKQMVWAGEAGDRSMWWTGGFSWRAGQPHSCSCRAWTCR